MGIGGVADDQRHAGGGSRGERKPQWGERMEQLDTGVGGVTEAGCGAGVWGGRAGA